MSEKIGTILLRDGPARVAKRCSTSAIWVTEQLRASFSYATVIEDEREKAAVEVEGHVPQDLLDKYHSETHATGAWRDREENRITASEVPPERYL